MVVCEEEGNEKNAQRNCHGLIYGTLTYLPGWNEIFHESPQSGYSVSQLKSEDISSGIQALVLNVVVVHNFIFIIIL
jgi:hypothetical protein